MTGTADPGGIGRLRPGPLARIGHDPDALEAFYTEHVTAVTRFVARRVADPHTVADLTAEVSSRSSTRRTATAPAGACRWPGCTGSPATSSPGSAAAPHTNCGRPAGSPAARLTDDDDIARLEERIDTESAGRAACLALAGLPPDERAVLELVAVDGLPVTDAAAALGIRPGTARVRLHRARRAAQQAMGRGAVPSSACPDGETDMSTRPALIGFETRLLAELRQVVAERAAFDPRTFRPLGEQHQPGRSLPRGPGRARHGRRSGRPAALTRRRSPARIPAGGAPRCPRCSPLTPRRGMVSVH